MSTQQGVQKFHRGDLVQVAKDLGKSMSHFINDCRAIVIHSYNDECPSSQDRHLHIYSIYIEGHGEVSWYNEDQLTLIAHKRDDLLDQWNTDRINRDRQLSDLDWVFSQGKELLERLRGATIQALAGCLGISENMMWGPQGEGFVLHMNSMLVANTARSFIESRDKIGWLSLCDAYKSQVEDQSFPFKRADGVPLTMLQFLGVVTPMVQRTRERVEGECDS